VPAAQRRRSRALDRQRRAQGHGSFADASILAVVEEFAEPEAEPVSPEPLPAEPAPAPETPGPAAKIDQLTARIDEQERTISGLKERLTAHETEPRRSQEPGRVPAPPERTAPAEPWQANPLIPRPWTR
jgi:hypothetical protein